MRAKQMVLAFIPMLFLISTLKLSAQQQGHLHLIQDPRIDSLLQLHRNLNKQLVERDEGFLEGYRIQIFMESGNDAVERAELVIEEFNEDFPHLQAYLIYRQPYYRVRVGDFRSRLEAEGQLKRISRQYSQAFVIKDKIRLPQLKYFDNQQHDL